MNVKLDATFWDEAYRSRDAAWSSEPNEHIVDTVEGLPPGRALDVGCGAGADAIWLAERGWRVTATDISFVALERGRANDRTGHVEWLQADILVWEPPRSTYDLVAAHFVHFANPERERMFGQLAAAVRARGVLLVVAHHPSDLQTTAAAGRCPTSTTPRMISQRYSNRPTGRSSWRLVAGVMPSIRMGGRSPSTTRYSRHADVKLSYTLTRRDMRRRGADPMRRLPPCSRAAALRSWQARAHDRVASYCAAASRSR